MEILPIILRRKVGWFNPTSEIRVQRFGWESDSTGRHVTINLSDLNAGETIYIVGVGMGGEWTDNGSTGVTELQQIEYDNTLIYRYWTAKASSTNASIKFKSTAGYMNNTGWVFYW